MTIVKDNKRDYQNAPEMVKDFYFIQHSKLDYDFVEARHK